MNKLYNKLHGNRIFLLVPKEEKSKIILSPEAKKELELANIQKYAKLEVFDVGDLVTTIGVGDIVFVDPERLSKAPIIPIGDGVEVFLVSPFDVILTW